jgi:hypothetical protein
MAPFLYHWLPDAALDIRTESFRSITGFAGSGVNVTESGSELASHALLSVVLTE